MPRALYLSAHLLVSLAIILGNDGFQIASPSRSSRYLLSSSRSATAGSDTQTVYATSSSTEANDALGRNPFGLTPELLKIADAFEAIGDDKLRYKQLLYMANQLKPMDPLLMIPDNKVPGCLSTVHIDGYVQVETSDGNDKTQKLIHFTGDSDGLLTKGLVALLVRGLSGNTAEDIQKVDPAFIKKAGIAASLTPGRNNGFLNMLAVMKRKASQLDEECEADTSDSKGVSEESGGPVADEDLPKYNTILETLQALKPSRIELRDDSNMQGGGKETHFTLDIVAEAFDGLNMIKRHQLVYMVLGEVMPQIEGLQIQALTPGEVAAREN